MSVDVEKGKYMKPEGSKTWEYLICFTCTIMFLVSGFVHGWCSPATMIFMAPDSPIPITASDASTFIAATAVGFVVSTPLSMYLIDNIGRKKIMLISVLPMAIGWGLIAIATNIWVLYIARFLNGMSFGSFFNPLSIYIAEVTSPCLRGAVLTINSTLYNVGILIAYVIVPYMSIPTSATILMTMSVVYFVIFYFMPESPYYLAMEGNIESAEAVLEKLRGKTNVSDELELVLETIKSNSRRRTGGIWELLTVRANRRAFIINNIFLCSLQFSGYYTILLFVQLIFKPLTSVISDHMITIVLGVVQVIATLIITFVIDRLGRKPLILISGIVVTIANFVIAAFFFAKDFLYMDVSAYSLIPFIAMIVLMCANTCGPGTLHIIVQSEIFAIKIKALALCFGGIVSSIFHLISAKTYILIANTWGYGPMPAFLSYAVNTVICTAVILRLMPETKSKTFVQIQKELDD